MSVQSREAKLRAIQGEVEPLHEINVPKLDPYDLMPQRESNRLRALSLFSGGGGLDLGFDRAGFSHVASYEILGHAAETLKRARPNWVVNGNQDGDVTSAKWTSLSGEVDIVHGGPPCQPFSIAGRQKGADDTRDMWPELVRCIRAVKPRAFVAENVPALASKKFAPYVQSQIIDMLSYRYHIKMLMLRAEDFGVPQIRRRVVFVGFARKKDAVRFVPPAATHRWGDSQLEFTENLERCMGAREALGLPDIGFDALSPTIRSSLTGPRHTTSILNSVAAQRTFEALQIWPNGVAATREKARAYVANNGHFRLSVQDVAVLQGFPEDWPFDGATYMQLGQLGNAVPPPMGYAVASSVAAAFEA
ncbi:DNA (cytosine-5-)-methyltransferase [Nocardia panacis]|uniref:Cytosine-specific methyltransferase n=1 Tax=Nocardia panacis TaxID=2340916 RepID=A0A3A4KD98_9NOCA|nr:DNA (cytosine-5-)-methyltransferase [Nocardia panacis]RJO76691.1 DNA (cytosine-5-)-methyltransferase [Nocardia panacis]